MNNFSSAEAAKYSLCQYIYVQPIVQRWWLLNVLNRAACSCTAKNGVLAKLCDNHNSFSLSTLLLGCSNLLWSFTGCSSGGQPLWQACCKWALPPPKVPLSSPFYALSAFYSQPCAPCPVSCSAFCFLSCAPCLIWCFAFCFPAVLPVLSPICCVPHKGRLWHSCCGLTALGLECTTLPLHTSLALLIGTSEGGLKSHYFTWSTHLIVPHPSLDPML